MSQLLIIVSIGVGFAALTAFAVAALTPGGETTAAEDRLQSLATRRRPGETDAEDEPSLLLAGGLDDTKNFASMVLSSMPALGTYMNQAGVMLEPSKFLIVCASFFAVGF